MTSQRPYQGYPYVNPSVIDVPTISADVAAKWSNLPRKPIEANWRRDISSPGSPTQEERKNSNPVVVYIDLPEDGASSITERLESYDAEFQVVNSPTTSADSKRESDAPVVYIDLPTPEPSGSDVAQTPVQPEEPTFVQDTIYYNQFDNRRIDRSKQADDSDDDSEPSSRPRRPNHLDLSGAGPSTANPPFPPSMTKQTEIYAGAGPSFDTIPASQFPEPPPAYEELQTTPVVEQPRPTPVRPPRTQVIVPGDYPRYQPDTPLPNVTQITRPRPQGLPDPGRKFLTCQHCGQRVHTLVIRESGSITHTIACIFLMLCILPALIFVYCTEHLKVKNHYCPNCNQLIGYQRPLCGSKIHYSAGHTT